jgi:hypothetical protein
LLSLCKTLIIFLFWIRSVSYQKKGRLVLPKTSCVYYEITLLSVCKPLIFWGGGRGVCIRSVSYQTKVGEQFFPELLVSNYVYFNTRLIINGSFYFQDLTSHPADPQVPSVAGAPHADSQCHTLYFSDSQTESHGPQVAVKFFQSLITVHTNL